MQVSISSWEDSPTATQESTILLFGKLSHAEDIISRWNLRFRWWHSTAPLNTFSSITHGKFESKPKYSDGSRFRRSAVLNSGRRNIYRIRTLPFSKLRYVDVHGGDTWRQRSQTPETLTKSIQIDLVVIWLQISIETVDFKWKSIGFFSIFGKIIRKDH